MRVTIWGLVLFLLSTPAVATWNNTEYVKQAFKLIALSNEYDNFEHPVRKWQQPVRVYLDHRVGDAPLHTMLATIQLNDLTRATGHDIALVDTAEKANVRVVFTRESRWQDETRELWPSQKTFPFRGAICMAHLALNKKAEIKQALIVIPVDLARHRGKLFACVVEELTQMMGLPNDSEKVFPSIFNDATKNNLMTPLDITLLRILYSPEIRAGMSEAQVMPRVEAWLQKTRGWPQQSTDMYLQSAFITEFGLR